MSNGPASLGADLQLVSELLPITISEIQGSFERFFSAVALIYHVDMREHTMQ